MILAIDSGNTFTKLATYDKGQQQKKWTCKSAELKSYLDTFVKKFDPDSSLSLGWISVSQADKLARLDCWKHFKKMPTFHYIHSQSELPIVNKYSTPQTLGTDRIVAVIAALDHNEGGPVLTIDAGTAITYDLADAEGAYLGGGIAPGIRLRFKALNDYTARLPLVENREQTPLVGDSTVNSIASGVINGMAAEIEGMIGKYKEAFGEGLTVYMTGGDALLFENQTKSVNFVAPDLVLMGIDTIIRYREQ